MLMVCSVSFHAFISALTNLYVYINTVITVIQHVVICTLFCNLFFSLNILRTSTLSIFLDAVYICSPVY